ncbi:cellulose-growth-specific protein [Epithele typhae]|uniref:cellulose-growth-specific protein n=1 Tax=Epithele typhae TaxID=378194 RepID=UPI002007EF70|nr:cellulose-growth-specific protein [Epithele typhae]KAH9915032.1 cellulose-growth-specific protein [Epithele typhae]
MISAAALATALALGVAQVTAHGGVLEYDIDGVTYKGFKAYNTPVGQSSIQREWDTYDPITDPTASYISCNTKGATLGSGQLSAQVEAGATVTAYWNTWPHTIGPVMVYMANCDGPCTSATPAALDWFKIEHAGLLSGDLPTGAWAQGALVAANSSWTTTIPAALAPGEYMLRHELLAIHTPNQAQFYPECAQLIVTGSGSAVPPAKYLVKLPGAYAASDPGVTLDVYAQPGVTNYTIPGPAVWKP